MTSDREPYGDVVNRLAESFETPDVDGVYQRMEHRNQQRRRVQQGIGAAVLVFVLAGVTALWFIQTQSTEVTTATTGSVTEDGTAAPTATTTEVNVAQTQNDLQNLFHDVQIWNPVVRTGIPDSDYFNEAVYFGSDGPTQLLTFGSCISAFYEINWTQDGFTITGTHDPGPIPADGCDGDGPEGLALTPVTPGDQISITQDGDTYTLTGPTWTLQIQPVTTSPVTEDETASPTTEAITIEPQAVRPGETIELTAQRLGEYFKLEFWTGVEWERTSGTLYVSSSGETRFVPEGSPRTQVGVIGPLTLQVPGDWMEGKYRLCDADLGYCGSFEVLS